jgi:hypothetical protein
MGEQLIEEVVAELTDDIVENVRGPNVRCNGALAGEVSSSSATEAGAWAWEHAHPGLVDIYQYDRRKHRHWSLRERDWDVCGCWSGEYAHCTQLRQSSQKTGQRVSSLGMAEHFVLPEGAYMPPIVVGEVRGGSRHRDRDVDLQVEAGAIFGDPVWKGELSPSLLPSFPSLLAYLTTDRFCDGLFTLYVNRDIHYLSPPNHENQCGQ